MRSITVDLVRMTSQPATGSGPVKTYAFSDALGHVMLTVSIITEGDTERVEVVLKRDVLPMKVVRGDDFVFEGKFRDPRRAFR